MPSGKSLFNFGLFVKNLKRFWPIWGFYLLIWVIALPARILVDRYGPGYLGSYAYDMLSTLGDTGLALSFCFGPLAAMTVFSYLYKAKAANLIHTLPIRREGLFLTNFLSGLCFLIGPNVLVFLLSLAASAARGWGYHPMAWMWLLVQCLTCLFFYCFAVFCGMFTGTQPALPIFYVILNFIFPGLYLLVNSIFQRFLYGFAGWKEDSWVGVLWPIPRMAQDIGVRTQNGALQFDGLATVLLYGLAGLLLAAAALFVYRRRHIERAGDVVSVGLMRPVFKYGLAFCCALIFGCLLDDWLTSGGGGESAWRLIACLLFCGALGYFIAEMLLRKSFKVLRAWRGCAAFAAALLLCCLALELDLTGFERRVPDNVASVEISSVTSMPYDTARYSGQVITDPALIAAVRELHESIVWDAMAGRPEYDPYSYQSATQKKYPDAQTHTNAALNLTYTLANGSVVKRRYYDIPVTDALLDTPGSSAALLEALVNHPALNGYAPFDTPGLSPNSARLSFNERDEITLSTREAREVYSAMHEDFAAGRIGRRFLLENQEYLETCYVNDLIFRFSGASSDKILDGVAYPSYVYGDSTSVTFYDVTFTLQTTSTSTIAALVRLGVIDSAEELTTYAEEYDKYRD